MGAKNKDLIRREGFIREDKKEKKEDSELKDPLYRDRDKEGRFLKTSKKQLNRDSVRLAKIKRALHKRDLDTEAFWDIMTEYIETDGFEKYVDEMMKLKGKDYMINYARIVEYFKPKLQKTDANITKKDEMEINFIPAQQVCPHCKKSLMKAV